MSIRISLTDVVEDVKRGLNDGYRQPMEHAATATMGIAGVELKTRGRANIGAAGFSTKWQNAWRVDVYPKGSEVSLTPAVYGHHNIPYSLIFETGGSITGKKGLLWLPLRNTPLEGAGRGKVTPRKLALKGVKLFTLRGHHGRPLLAANVSGATTRGSLSLAKLRRKPRPGGATHAVPLFFGIQSVDIRKRFDIAGVAAQIKTEIPALYESQVAAQIKDGAGDK